MVSLSSVRKPLSSAWLTPRFVGIRCAVHSTTDGFDDIAAPGGLVRSLAQASATREPDFGPDDGPRDRPGAARSRSSRGRRCERSTVSRSSTSSRLSRSRSGHRGTGHRTGGLSARPAGPDRARPQRKISGAAAGAAPFGQGDNGRDHRDGARGRRGYSRNGSILRAGGAAGGRCPGSGLHGSAAHRAPLPQALPSLRPGRSPACDDRARRA